MSFISWKSYTNNGIRLVFLAVNGIAFLSGVVAKKKNYNSKREDKKEEDQPEDERNVIL